MFRGRYAALCSTGPGRIGGLRGLRHLREILSDMGGWVVPQIVAVPEARAVFDDQTLTDPTRQAAVQTMLDALLDATRPAAAIRAAEAANG